jgi:hypothetical protein
MRNEGNSTPLVMHSSDVWAESRRLHSIIFRTLVLKGWRHLLRVRRRISSADLEALTPLLLFCGAGLLVSLLAISCGLDLSYGYGF